MLEMLLLGSAGQYLPQSGPGTKILEKGDLEIGYFGEVTSTELFSTSELSGLVGLVSGTILDEYPVWLKFAYRGKFLFIPRRQIRHTLTWDALYFNGLVYGVEGIGPHAANLPTYQTEQLTLVSKGNYQFKVRLMAGDITDPASTVVNGAGDTNYNRDSEYDQLINRVRGTLKDKVTESWEQYTDAELGFNQTGNYTVVKEHHSGLINILLRGPVISAAQRGGVSSSCGWRPVLELIEVGELFTQHRHGYRTDVELTAVGAFVGLPEAVGAPFYPLSVQSYSVELDSDLAVPLLRQYGHDYDLSISIIELPTVRGLARESDALKMTSGLQASPYENPVTLRQTQLTQRDVGFWDTGGARAQAQSNSKLLAPGALVATIDTI